MTVHAPYRSKYELIGEALEHLSVSALSVTNVMYKLRTTHPYSRDLCNSLVEKGLATKNEDAQYVITSKGLKYVELFTQVKGLLA